MSSISFHSYHSVHGASMSAMAFPDGGDQVEFAIVKNGGKTCAENLKLLSAAA
jgi:hypothetical protein